jgi:hypothetical protein
LTLDNIPGTNISFCGLSFVGICGRSEKAALNADMTFFVEIECDHCNWRVAGTISRDPN